MFGVLSAWAQVSFRLGLALSLVFAMLFGLAPEPSLHGVGSATTVVAVTTDANDHATQQHGRSSDARELVAEAEESRDELEESVKSPAATLSVGAPALVSERSLALDVTWRRGGPGLGGVVGLGRGPPTRA